VIRCKLVLFNNRKSHAVFRLVPISVTFNDLERRNGRRPALSLRWLSYLLCLSSGTQAEWNVRWKALRREITEVSYFEVTRSKRCPSYVKHRRYSSDRILFSLSVDETSNFVRNIVQQCCFENCCENVTRNVLAGWRHSWCDWPVMLKCYNLLTYYDQVMCCKYKRRIRYYRNRWHPHTHGLL